MLIHSVARSTLNLPAGRERIAYQVAVVGNPGSPAIESRWIPLDLAQRVVDPTPHGIGGTPWSDEGQGPRVRVDPTAARTAGFSASHPLRLLLLHAQAGPGLQVETVTLDLDREDVDRDGLPDLWELEGLGDLSSGAMDDPDQDGRSNAQELVSRTPPLDLRLLPPSSGSGTVRWIGPVGRTYSLERSTGLAGPFWPVVTGIPGTGGIQSTTDPSPPAQDLPWFYRIRVE